MAISFRGSATSNTTSIDISATGRAAGDLCVIVNLCSDDTNTPAQVTPSGFTHFGTGDTGTGFGQHQRFDMYYKVLAGTETTLSLMSGNQAEDAIAVVFNPGGGTWTGPFSVVDAADLSGATVPSSQTVTSSGGTPPLVVIGDIEVFINTLPLGSQWGTLTPAADAYVNSTQYSTIGYKIYNSSPADEVVGSTNGSNTVLAGAYFQASGATPDTLMGQVMM